MRDFSDGEIEELKELCHRAFGEMVAEGDEDAQQLAATLSLMNANGASPLEDRARALRVLSPDRGQARQEAR